jgi:hypothetical protein
MVRRSSVFPPGAVPLLVAVGALLGPGAASAGSPAPDPPGSIRAPAPDPAPTALSHPAVVQTVRAAAVSTPHVVFTPPRVHIPARPAAPRRHNHVAKAKAPAVVVDVPALQVDRHLGLGAIAPSLRDDSKLLMAGVALLVAAMVAASAVALTLVAARSPRSAT